MKFTYLIGPPGSGKSTLMRWLRFGSNVVPKEINNWLIAWMAGGEAKALEIGGLRPLFGGTDALSMSIIEKAEPFVRANQYDLFAEGDRLANDRFFTAIVETGYEFHLFYLDTPAELCAARREERARLAGVQLQDPKWVSGRETKARRLAEKWSAKIIRPIWQPDVLAHDILKEIA